MPFFTGFLSIFDRLSAAQSMSNLLSLSDRELQARGFDREALTRSYIHGLGAR